jgi:gas vesicle protein
MKDKNLIIGLLGGVAVGAVLGVLFAPAKGSETRKKITDKSHDLKDSLKDTACRISDKISQTVSSLKNETQDVIADAKEILHEEKANLDNIKQINKSNIL